MPTLPRWNPITDLDPEPDLPPYSQRDLPWRGPKWLSGKPHRNVKPPQRILKEKLYEFWRTFGGAKYRGRHFPPAFKLRMLRKFAAIKIKIKCGMSPEEKRHRFEKVKRRRHQLWIYRFCFVCGGPATCRHHIVQLQHGGYNVRRNFVSLCFECHAKVHPWLAKQSTIPV